MTTATKPHTPRPRVYQPTIADKAEALTVNTQTWLRLRSDDGRIVAYGIPSLTRPNRFHRTNGRQCDCEAGQQGRECCHVVAAALYIAGQKGTGANAPAPAPTLDAVRTTVYNGGWGYDPAFECEQDAREAWELDYDWATIEREHGADCDPADYEWEVACWPSR